MVKDWYDGYLFGSTEVYNPWSSIKIIQDLTDNPNVFPQPYWANTSSNSIVRTLIDKADDDAKADLDTLIAGSTIQKTIHEDITYDESDTSPVEKNIDNIWNFLFFTGYLKKTSEHADSQDNLVLGLTIPNKELFCIYRNKIQEWFKETIEQQDLSSLYTAILEGNAQAFEDELSAKCDEALRQIEEKEYIHELEQEGYQHILKYGIAFCRKDCMVKMADSIIKE